MKKILFVVFLAILAVLAATPIPSKVITVAVNVRNFAVGKIVESDKVPPSS